MLLLVIYTSTSSHKGQSYWNTRGLVQKAITRQTSKIRKKYTPNPLSQSTPPTQAVALQNTGGAFEAAHCSL